MATAGGGLLALGGHIVMLVGVLLPWLQGPPLVRLSVAGLDFITSETSVGLNPILLVGAGAIGIIGAIAMISDGGEYRRPGAAVSAICAVVGLVVLGSIYLEVSRNQLPQYGLSFGLGFWVSGLGAILALIGGAYETLQPDVPAGVPSAQRVYEPPPDPRPASPPVPVMAATATVPAEPARPVTPRTEVQAAMEGRSWSRVGRAGALPGRWSVVASILEELPAGASTEVIETPEGVEFRGTSGDVLLALGDGSYAVSVPADDLGGTRLVSGSRGPSVLLHRIEA